MIYIMYVKEIVLDSSDKPKAFFVTNGLYSMLLVRSDKSDKEAYISTTPDWLIVRIKKNGKKIEEMSIRSTIELVYYGDDLESVMNKINVIEGREWGGN